jgi:hypothetical protein
VEQVIGLPRGKCVRDPQVALGMVTWLESLMLAIIAYRPLCVSYVKQFYKLLAANTFRIVRVILGSTRDMFNLNNFILVMRIRIVKCSFL